MNFHKTYIILTTVILETIYDFSFIKFIIIQANDIILINNLIYSIYIFNFIKL